MTDAGQGIGEHDLQVTGRVFFLDRIGGVGVHRRAALGRQHDQMAGFVQQRVHRGVVAGVDVVADDPGFVVAGLELATQMVLDLCGGEASEVVVAGKEPLPHKVIDLPLAEVKRLSGLDLAADTIVTTLEKLGFKVTGSGDSRSVVPPIPMTSGMPWMLSPSGIAIDAIPGTGCSGQ